MNAWWKKLSSGVLLFLLAFPLLAANLADIRVSNGKNESRIALQFTGQPIYSFFPLQRPERLVIDISQTNNVIPGLPLHFSGKNLVQKVRTSTAKKENNLRLVVELTGAVKTTTSVQKEGSKYTLTLVLKRAEQLSIEQKERIKLSPAKQEISTKSTAPIVVESGKYAVVSSTKNAKKTKKNQKNREQKQIVVAIDAGHGGQDPGAIGPSGIQEKVVTLAIARKLKTLLVQDPRFKPVMSRDGDYFISVMGRSDVARNKKANLLVSIHADAAPNRNASGASIWVLSNRRANTELGRWLEQHEKQSELLGGAGEVLENTSDRYLSHAVLDLQFGHSQRVGYDVAVKILQQLGQLNALHKRTPEHASLGVLRSPDIPSLLVETGFISNHAEEKLLFQSAHQDRIAKAVYQGIRNYYQVNPLQMESTASSSSSSSSSSSDSSPKKRKEIAVSSPSTPGIKMPQKNSTGVRLHVVKQGDTLSSIATRYGVSLAKLKQHNNIQSDIAVLGTKLTIPAK